MNLHCNDDYSPQVLHEQWEHSPATILLLFPLHVNWFMHTSGETVAFSLQFDIFCIQDSSSNFGPCNVFFVRNNRTRMYMLKSYKNCPSSFLLLNEWVAVTHATNNFYVLQTHFA